MTLFKNKYRVESTRLKYWDYSSDGAYFVTICTKNRIERFGEIRNGIIGLNEEGCIAVKFWQEIPNHFTNVILGEWVIMPNHVHGIIVIHNHSTVETIHELSLRDYKQRRKMLIPKIIGWFKMQSSKYINILNHLPGRSFWQLNYYDRIIRNDEEFNNICEYIQYNPLKWEWDRNNPKNL